MDNPLNARIATSVRQLRSDRGLSLDAFAKASGVSKSMISLVERGETSATAVVLEKLATALGVSLAALFDAPAAIPADPVARRARQLPWRDPQSGYVRRNVSPPGVGPIQIVEVDFPPKARVVYTTGARAGTVHQQIWVLEGTIEVTLGDRRHDLQTGDCLAMVLDRPVAYHNPKDEPARYAVVIVG